MSASDLPDADGLGNTNAFSRRKTKRTSARPKRPVRISVAAIAAIAAQGVGQMGGYGAVLGESGVEQVAAYVWQQAQAGWPKA